jgi:hypothetical protein
MAYLNDTTKVQDWLSRLASALPRLASPRRSAVLDERSLSEHLKRDMGFLDSAPTRKRR